MEDNNDWNTDYDEVKNYAQVINGKGILYSIGELISYIRPDGTTTGGYIINIITDSNELEVTDASSGGTDNKTFTIHLKDVC